MPADHTIELSMHPPFKHREIFNTSIHVLGVRRV
jgi:hypothetical protein